MPVSTAGAIAGPSEADELNTAIGSDRARCGYQSVITRVPPVYIGDSPSPSATRAPSSCGSRTHAALAICAIDHSTSPIPSTRRAPQRSTNAPAGI